MSLESTVSPSAMSGPAITKAAATVRGSTRQFAKLTARLRTAALALIVPLGLLLVWDLMVRWTGTRLVPPPSGVATMM